MAGVIGNPFHSPIDNPLVSHKMPTRFWFMKRKQASKCEAFTGSLGYRKLSSLIARHAKPDITPRFWFADTKALQEPGFAYEGWRQTGAELLASLLSPTIQSTLSLSVLRVTNTLT
jgi:hypothetical protein